MPRAQLTDLALESMRRRLSEAALAIYRKDGLDAVSFRQIAEAAGISHTLPYRYFDNKEALLADVRRLCFERFDEFVKAGEAGVRDPVGRIRAITARYVEFVEAHPADYLLMFSAHQPPPDQYPDLLAARRALFDRTVDAIQACIDAGFGSGDARRITHMGWVSIHGLLTLHVANQLVHGYRMPELVEPLLQMILGQLTVRLPARASRSTSPKPRTRARTPRR